MFISTLARRERDARNFQEIQCTYTYQFVDEAGMYFLETQPKSKYTELSKKAYIKLILYVISYRSYCTSNT